MQKLTHYSVTLRIRLIYKSFVNIHLEFLTSKLLLKPLNCPCYLLLSLHCCFCIKCKPQVVSPHSALFIMHKANLRYQVFPPPCGGKTFLCKPQTILSEKKNIYILTDRPSVLKGKKKKKKKDLPTAQHKKFWVGKQQTNNFLRLALCTIVLCCAIEIHVYTMWLFVSKINN